MAITKLILDRACRIRGDHHDAGAIVELDGVDPKMGELTGEARAFVARGWAHEPSDADLDATKKKSAKS